MATQRNVHVQYEPFFWHPRRENVGDVRACLVWTDPYSATQRGLSMFDKTPITVRIWLRLNLSFSGITPDRILKHLILRMALSTWIRRDAILLDRARAFAAKVFPLLKAGMLRVAFFGSNKWRMLNPLSAMMSSVGSMRSMNRLCFTMSKSDRLD